eukprot:SAG31_NODE_19317_length_606_cov_0.818540_1_plen_42_part_10
MVLTIDHGEEGKLPAAYKRSTSAAMHNGHCYEWRDSDQNGMA